MHFSSETSSNGVIERNFILDEITGVLWSHASGTVGSPLLLAGHTGGMHKKAPGLVASALDRKSTRLNSSHQIISYAVFCLKKKKKRQKQKYTNCACTTQR